MEVLKLIGRFYGRFALRTFAVVGCAAFLIVGSDVLYTAVFIHSLQAQTFDTGEAVKRRATQDDDHTALVRSVERIDQLSGRVTTLEQVRGDVRLAIIESKLDTQSWFLKAILAAAVAQGIAFIGRGVSWMASRREERPRNGRLF